jgi:uncharacterized protein YfdQ (DUF2303 family)
MPTPNTAELLELQPGENIAQTVHNITASLMTPETLTLADGVDVVSVPNGIALKSIKPFLDEYRTQPERRKGTAKLTDLRSFIDHVNRFKDADTVLFACDSRTNPSITAVLDYHRAGSEAEPRFGEHKSHYGLPLSDEWKAWKAKNGEVFRQHEFAAFLEDRIVDVVHIHDEETLSERTRNFAALVNGSFATPTKLLTLSNGLSVTADEKVQNHINLQSGEMQVTFSSDHRDESGQPISVPKMFMVAIPVFLNGPLYQIAVRLRYRIKDKQIVWFYEMHQTELVFDDAFNDACITARDSTDLPLFMGSPEV